MIGLAGVMGGAATEVSAETRDVLLEAAYWDPPRIRRTRRALGMSTEASYRFERGIDRWGGGDAMRRCIEIVLATGGGELADAPLDLWPEPSHPPRIFLRPARVAQVLGVEVPWNAIEQYLVAIGATVVSKPDDGRIAVDVPGWRPDLVREIDLIEEIARLHGYDTFPSDLRPFRLGHAARRARGGGHRRGPPRHGGAGSLRGLPPPDRRRPTATTASACSTRSPPTMPGSAAGCCPAWCGWSRATGPTTSRTCACSRSAPPGPPAGPASARGRSDGWRPCSPAPRAAPLDRHRARTGSTSGT